MRVALALPVFGSEFGCSVFAGIHSLALRATNGQDLRTPRKFYYAAKSAGCLTLAFCVTSTKQRRTEPNVGGDRPRQPAVDGGSRTLGRAPRWGANVAWGSLPRVRCATLGYDVQPRCGCREGHCQILELGTWNLELGTWNLEPALGLPGEASAGLVWGFQVSIKAFSHRH